MITWARFLCTDHWLYYCILYCTGLQNMIILNQLVRLNTHFWYAKYMSVVIIIAKYISKEYSNPWLVTRPKEKKETKKYASWKFDIRFIDIYSLKYTNLVIKTYHRLQLWLLFRLFSVQISRPTRSKIISGKSSIKSPILQSITNVQRKHCKLMFLQSHGKNL